MENTPTQSTKTKIGQDSVQRIAQLMRVRGCHVKSKLPYLSPFDLLCNGKRVEVKTAEFRRIYDSSFGWQVNLHRHGAIDEAEVDIYVFELRADFLPLSIILIYEAPLGVATLAWTASGLLKGKYAEHVDNWELLGPSTPNPTLPELMQATPA